MEKSQKIKVFAFAKFQTVLGAFIGLICGVLYSFGGLILDILVSIEWVTSQETPGLSYGTVLAFGALIGMPIIGAAFGFLLGLFEAVLFNVFVRFFGKIRINFERKE